MKHALDLLIVILVSAVIIWFAIMADVLGIWVLGFAAIALLFLLWFILTATS